VGHGFQWDHANKETFLTIVSDHVTAFETQVLLSVAVADILYHRSDQRLVIGQLSVLDIRAERVT
jgi:hypothetical protein